MALGNLSDLVIEVVTNTLAMRVKNLDGDGNEIFTEDYPGYIKQSGSIVKKIGTSTDDSFLHGITISPGSSVSEQFHIPARKLGILLRQGAGNEHRLRITWRSPGYGTNYGTKTVWDEVSGVPQSALIDVKSPYGEIEVTNYDEEDDMTISINVFGIA